MLQVTTPAKGEIPGAQPLNLAACLTFEAAEEYARQLVAGDRAGAKHEDQCMVFYRPFAPSERLLAQTPVVMGPLEDWEGDVFTVHEVTRQDGSHFYPFVWWPQGYKPTGLRI